ncbi:MAG: hypothetical protein KGL32_01245 [candidate division NC10 bacterium]|nr:hypothetical protein [candidate division NC10 bacterium]
MRNLEPTIERYCAAKIEAMIEEAQRTLEKAEGDLRRAQELKQRAAAFPSEFRQRYGLEQEGE